MNNRHLIEWIFEMKNKMEMKIFDKKKTKQNEHSLLYWIQIKNEKNEQSSLDRMKIWNENKIRMSNRHLIQWKLEIEKKLKWTFATWLNKNSKLKKN